MILAWFVGMFVCLVAAATIAAVLVRGRVKSEEDFYASSGRFAGLVSALTYAATTYSSFMMVGLVGLVYATGVGALGFELAYLIATLALLSTIGPLVWRLSRQRGWVAPSEIISDLYGSKWLGRLVAVVYLVALTPYAAAQFVGIGRILEGMGLGFETGVIVMLALSIVWTLTAGMWSVAVTDAVQGVWMIASAVALVAWLLGFMSAHGVALGDAADKLGLTRFWSIDSFLALTIPWIFFSLTNPQVLQRLYLPRDARAYRRMVALFGAYGYAYTLLVTVVGLAAAALTARGLLPEVHIRDRVTPVLLARLAPEALAAAVYVGILAASITTVDSIVLSVASSIAREFDIHGFRAAYATVVALNTAAALIALARPAPIVELSVLSSFLLLSLLPATLVALALREKASMLRHEAAIGMVAAFALGLALAVINGAKRTLLLSFNHIPASLIIIVVAGIPLAARLIRLGCCPR